MFAAAEIRAACDGFSAKKLIGRGVSQPIIEKKLVFLSELTFIIMFFVEFCFCHWSLARGEPGPV